MRHIWFDLQTSNLRSCILCAFIQSWPFAIALQVLIVCLNFWHLLHSVSNLVLMNSTNLHVISAMIISFSLAFFNSFFNENEILIDEYFLLIQFSCSVNHIDSRVNLIEFQCSIFFQSCCILFKILNTSISISCTIASCHFSSLLILSNSNRFFHIFRYSINFCAFEFSIIVNTMCCSVWNSCTLCINTLYFYTVLVHRLFCFNIRSNLSSKFNFLILQLCV